MAEKKYQYDGKTIEKNTPDKVIVRQANSDDAIHICRLRKALWVATYQQPEYQLAVQHQDFLSEKQVAVFANSISGEKHYHLVAEYQNKIIGWGAAEIIKNEIIALYVHTDYQHKGIGKSFYRLLMKQLNTKENIIIYAVLGNEKAINFYDKNGFKFLEQPSTQEITEGLKNHKLPLVKMQLTP